MSYCCDRARSVTWGIKGGLPSIPHGVWLNAARATSGSSARSSPTSRSARATPSPGRRPAAAGYGDPLERDPAAVLRGRRRRLRHRRARAQGLRRRRARGRRRARRVRGRRGGHRARARADPRASAPAGSRRTPRPSPRATAPASSTTLDLVRQYGVILDWGTGELLPRTTEQFRAMLQRRAAAHWADAAQDA